MPLIIEGGAYNLCWCGPPARTWNIAPGRWNRVERQWLVWQVIGVAQVIKNGVLMGSSYYESLMFAQVYYVYYIYIYYIRSDSFLEPDTGHVPRVCMVMSSWIQTVGLHGLCENQLRTSNMNSIEEELQKEVPEYTAIIFRIQPFHFGGLSWYKSDIACKIGCSSRPGLV